MLLTLADAIDTTTGLGPIVNGGTCDTTVLTNRTNECIEWLIEHADSRYTRIRCKMHVTNNCIPLPYEAEDILGYTYDGYAGHVRSNCYEFLEGGPLDLDTNYGIRRDVVDLGARWPTFYEIDTDYPNKLIAFSTEEEDTARTIRVRGFGQYRNEIFTGTTPGELVPINRWDRGVEGSFVVGEPSLSSNIFYDISSIVKPVTKGYVSLYAYDASSGQMWFLGKYRPNETQPGYRRYKFLNQDWENGSYVVALLQLRYVPAIHTTDVLLVQSMAALKAMAHALEGFDNNDPRKFGTYQKIALSKLMDIAMRHRVVSNEFQVENSDTWGMGGVDPLL